MLLACGLAAVGAFTHPTNLPSPLTAAKTALGNALSNINMQGSAFSPVVGQSERGQQFGGQDQGRNSPGFAGFGGGGGGGQGQFGGQGQQSQFGGQGQSQFGGQGQGQGRSSPGFQGFGGGSGRSQFSYEPESQIGQGLSQMVDRQRRDMTRQEMGGFGGQDQFGGMGQGLARGSAGFGGGGGQGQSQFGGQGQSQQFGGQGQGRNSPGFSGFGGGGGMRGQSQQVGGQGQSQFGGQGQSQFGGQGQSQQFGGQGQSSFGGSDGYGPGGSSSVGRSGASFMSRGMREDPGRSMAADSELSHVRGLRTLIGDAPDDVKQAAANWCRNNQVDDVEELYEDSEEVDRLLDDFYMALPLQEGSIYEKNLRRRVDRERVGDRHGAPYNDDRFPYNSGTERVTARMGLGAAGRAKGRFDDAGRTRDRYDPPPHRQRYDDDYPPGRGVYASGQYGPGMDRYGSERYHDDDHYDERYDERDGRRHGGMGRERVTARMGLGVAGRAGGQFDDAGRAREMARGRLEEEYPSSYNGPGGRRARYGGRYDGRQTAGRYDQTGIDPTTGRPYDRDRNRNSYDGPMSRYDSPRSTYTESPFDMDMCPWDDDRYEGLYEERVTARMGLSGSGRMVNMGSDRRNHAYGTYGQDSSFNNNW